MSERNDIPRPGPASDDGAGIDDDDCIIAYDHREHTAPSAAEVARFWSGADRSGGPDACWPWMKARYQNGYGAWQYRRRPTKAHRGAWLIAHGPIPHGLLVCHHCDNRACVNPAHLFLGTHQDNMADCLRKGRKASGDRSAARLYPEKYRGEFIGSAKLTEADVREIRALVDAGEPRCSLASRFGVTPSQISRIALGRGWTHLNTEADIARGERLKIRPQDGEHNNFAKLTWDVVEKIRAVAAIGGATQDQLASCYGVSQATVSRVIRGEGWTREPEPPGKVICPACGGRGVQEHNESSGRQSVELCEVCRATGVVSDLLASQLQRQGT